MCRFATSPAPSAITDFCTPLTVNGNSFGVSVDNPDTPANEGGVPLRTLLELLDDIAANG